MTENDRRHSDCGSITLVSTIKASYAGYRSDTADDGRCLVLERAAEIPASRMAPSEIALHYFGERAGRRLGRYELPYAAILEMREEPLVDTMLGAYTALSRVANKGVAGRITTARLKKMIGGNT